LFFRDDGLAAYVIADTGDRLVQYKLLTAWDISTMGYIRNESLATEGTTPNGVFFQPDGLAVFTSDSSGGRDLTKYTLSTAWDISSMSYDSFYSFTSGAQTYGPAGIFFNEDGTKVFVTDSSADQVDEYDL